MEGLSALADLGGTVVTVGLFLWYMRERNGKTIKALDRVAERMDHQTELIIKVLGKKK